MLYKLALLTALVSVSLCHKVENFKQDEENKLEEYQNAPIPYNFEFNTQDENGTSQFRSESSDGNGKVEGRYGYKDAFGIERIVEYIADENGYRAQIKTNEPGIESMSPASAHFYANPHPSNYYIASESKSSTEQKQDIANLQYSQEQSQSQDSSRSSLTSTEIVHQTETTTMKASEENKQDLAHDQTSKTSTESEQKKQHFTDKEQKEAAPQFFRGHFVHQVAPVHVQYQGTPVENSFFQNAPLQFVQPQAARVPFYRQAPQPLAVQYLAPHHPSDVYKGEPVQYAAAQPMFAPTNDLHSQSE